jgi:hypothetical protein
MAALYFPLHGAEFNKIAWPAATTVPYVFEALDLQEYQDANVVFALATGTATLDVDIAWSATGNPADAHSGTVGVISGAVPTQSVQVNRVNEDAPSDQYLIRDRFLHITATQTGTVEDSWIYVNGVS